MIPITKLNKCEQIEYLTKLKTHFIKLNTRWRHRTFSVLPLNLPRMLKRGTCGMISCSFSSLYSGAVGRSRVKYKKVDSDISSWYSSFKSNASFSSGGYNVDVGYRQHDMGKFPLSPQTPTVGNPHLLVFLCCMCIFTPLQHRTFLVYINLLGNTTQQQPDSEMN